MSDITKSIFRSLIIAVIVMIFTAGSAYAFSMDSIQPNTISKEKASLLAQKAYVPAQEAQTIIQNQPPVADFQYSVNGRKVNFTDTSAGSPTSWFWTFDDGTGSTQRSPTHAYANPGAYTVTLTVSNSAGSSSKTQTVSLRNLPDIVTGLIVVDKSSVEPGQQISLSEWTKNIGLTTAYEFYNYYYLSTDNVISSDDYLLGSKHIAKLAQNATNMEKVSLTIPASMPQNTYYILIRLDATGRVWESDENNDYSYTQPITIIGSKPDAKFTYMVNGKKVTFADTSTGNPTSWFWTFGDGTSSTQRSPTHTYASPGTYTVTLTVLSSAGSTSMTQILSLERPPVADFQYSVNGKTATFTDTSTGNPTSWSWTFGDGLRSTQQSPPHTYNSLGSYTVTLTVSNSAGSTSKTKTVNLNQPAAANFQYSVNGKTVTFTDTSTGGPAGWSWTFGDGSSSTQRNPVHTYTSGGTYTVTLTASSGTASSTVSKSVTLGDLPSAGFQYSVNKMIVTFSDASTGGATSWLWNFGDGSVSAVRNPYHIYHLPGTYPVKLTVTNTAGSSTIQKEVVVTGTVYTESADVVLGDITPVPTYLKIGEKVLIPIETINKGTATAKSFFNYYYLSRDPNYSIDDTWVGSQFISALPAGGSFTQTVTISIPPRIPEGLYYIVVVVDATGVVPESDENNVKSTAIPSMLTGKVAPSTIPTISPPSGYCSTSSISEGALSPLSQKAFSVYISPGLKSVTFKLDGPTGANFDLYVKMNRIPNIGDYTWAGTSSSADEEVTILSPSGGTYWILIRVPEGSGDYTLEKIECK